MKERTLKMYILVREGLPDDLVPVVAARTALATYLEFEGDPDMLEWKGSGRRMIVCIVGPKELERAARLLKATAVAEPGGAVASVGFCPNPGDRAPFKYYRLWKAGMIA